MIEVSIIIVNYNTVNLTKACIDSIVKYTQGLNYEIILVDNKSTDGSKQYFEKDKRIIYIYNEENRGFGGGNNQGALKASGKYLFFLNPDTLLLNNAIKELYDFYTSDKSIGICGGNLYDIELKPAHSFRRYLPGIQWEVNLLTCGLWDKIIYGKNRIFNYTKNTIEVGYVTGADLFISKDLFDKCGGFSSEFFMYYEETDLTNQVKRLGKRVYSVPSSKIQHLEGKSFSAEKEQRRRALTENGYQVYRRRNYSKWQKTLSKPLHFFYLTLKGVILKLR